MGQVVLLQLKNGGVAKAKGEGEKEKECTKAWCPNNKTPNNKGLKGTEIPERDRNSEFLPEESTLKN